MKYSILMAIFGLLCFATGAIQGCHYEKCWHQCVIRENDSWRELLQKSGYTPTGEMFSAKSFDVRNANGFTVVYRVYLETSKVDDSP